MIDIKSLLQMARHIVEDDNEEHHPLLIIVDEDEKINGVDLTPVPHESWDQAIKFVVSKVNAKEYAFISEAWFAKLDPDSPKYRALQEGKLRVSELPLDDRSEMLLLIHVWHGGKAEVRTAEIKRINDTRTVMPWKLETGFDSRFIVSW